MSIVSATNVAHTFAKLIDCILLNPHQPIGRLDPFTLRDFEQIRRWNSPFPDKIDACVHDLLLQHAKESPDSPAVCSWDGNLTYAELERASSSFAHYLNALGVGPEALVPVCFRKSMYTIVAMVAILRAGGAFVPLDPSHPKDRLQAIVRKANANIIVASPETAHLFEGMAITTVSLSSALLETIPSSVDCLPFSVRPDSAAFVLFTSGSTGSPKGIVQEHASVSTSSIAHGRAMYINSESRVLQYAAYTFDVSMMDIFTTLIYGGCVCTPSEEDRMGNITGIMNAMHVNWVLFTPSVASLIVPEDVPELQSLALGGEAVTKENVHRWAGKVRLINCYGPAESAASAVNLIHPQNSRPGTIGRAFGGGLCWVVDQTNHNRLVPIGAVGELLVEGPTLARGYLEDMEKTKAAFIKSPEWLYENNNGRPRRLYKTGDLVRHNSDGSLDFMGRKDLQLKVRGQRVELGEVEHHLSMYPGIALAIAASPLSGPYSKSLVAIIQLQQEAATLSTATTAIRLLPKTCLDAARVSIPDLALFLKSKLPCYMVPNHWLVVEKLPLSVSGKIDRKLVNSWLVSISRDMVDTLTNNGYWTVAIPKDETTAIEVSAKAASLVARDDPRFYTALCGQDFLLSAVGLDSIQVISLTMFIKRHFGVKIHPGTILHPEATVRGVARCIEEYRATGNEHAVETKVNFMGEFQRYLEALRSNMSAKGASIKTVLVTGATGYLGCQILAQLFTRIEIEKVIVHVRADSAAHGLQRIVHSATLAGWWSNSYLARLEVWIGDLTRPKVGLSTEQWDRLTGEVPPSQRIHAIIHNGATVNWNAEFSTLKAANVDSTLELLTAVNEVPSILKFVYISGGQQHSSNEQSAADGASLSTGYSQTKFLSELLVKEFSRSSARNASRVAIVQPSYIIGTPSAGIANIDDYIWRLVATCINIKAYNAADSASYLYISDVEHVAHTIVSSCCDPTPPSNPSSHHTTPSTSSTHTTPSNTPNLIPITTHLPIPTFWSVLTHDLNYTIHPLPQDAWLRAVHADIDAQREAHPLWPLLHTLETECGRLSAPGVPRGAGASGRAGREVLMGQEVVMDEGAGEAEGRVEGETEAEKRIRAAVRRNVEFLQGIGFLKMADGRKGVVGVGMDGKVGAGAGVFSRSRRVGG